MSERQVILIVYELFLSILLIYFSINIYKSWKEMKKEREKIRISFTEITSSFGKVGEELSDVGERLDKIGNRVDNVLIKIENEIKKIELREELGQCLYMYLEQKRK